MSTYLVYAPPQQDKNKNKKTIQEEEFLFVRDGFSILAAFVPVIWLLMNKMWRVFLIFMLAMMSIQALIAQLAGDNPTFTFAGLLLSVLIGLEASTLHRWELLRKGWREVGIATGKDQEEAERRFFDEYSKLYNQFEAQPEQIIPTQYKKDYTNKQRQQILGLFPQSSQSGQA